MFQRTRLDVFSHRLNRIASPLRIRDLESRLPDLGFEVSADGSHFFKSYSSNDGHLTIRVVSAGDTLYDATAELRSRPSIPLGPLLTTAERVVNRNLRTLASLSNIRVAQTGLGLPGGSGGLTGINVDESLGGPRWWLYADQADDVNALERWIQEQRRYNPEYMPVGEALEGDGEGRWEVVADVEGDVERARINRDRQEGVIEYVLEGDGQPRRARIPSTLGDVAQELNKYQVRMVRAEGSTIIMVKKVDGRGDAKGIWEINGKPSVPGYAYVDEDGRTSYSLHPELLDDPGWTSGDHSVGRAGYGYPER